MALRCIIGLLAGLLLSAPVLAQDADDACPLSQNKKARKLYNEALGKVRGSRSEARALLKQALEIDEDFARASWVMADLLIKSKKMKEAEPYLLKVAEICPDLDPLVFFRIGGIRFGEKNYRDAADWLKKFLDKKPGLAAEESEARDMLKASQFFIEGFAKPVPFDPRPLNDVSTAADEFLPIITPDNQTVYFTRRTKEQDRNSAYGGIKEMERFCFSDLIDENKFEVGKPMPPPFNRNFNEGGASLTADNRVMYFTVCRNEDGPTPNCDIWYSVNVRGQWSEIRNCGPNINGKTTWESQPSISGDGKILYFTSNREGGYGQLDIWKSVKDENGNWGVPENLGPVINTPGSEKSPFFHSDGQTLYFSSTGNLGYGGYDIFFSKLGKDGQWQTPKNIGYPINSEMDDLGFFVSTDGRTGYFASDKLKGAGGWDVYYFNLYKEARPERVMFLKGELKDENNKAITDARLEIRNVNTEEVTTVEVDSLTGKYVAVMAFNDDHIMTVKQPGKAFTSQYLSTSDSSIGKPQELNLEVKDLKVGTPYRLNNILFETNSYEISQQTVNILREFASYLKDNPGMKVAIHGHTDNIGDNVANLTLSTNRARKIYETLVAEGIGKSRLSYKGFGATKPVSSNNTEEGRANNRRTEFIILAR